MGFLAPALPWVIQGGAALGGALLGKKAQSSAMKRSPEEAAALSGAQGGAKDLLSGGKSLIASGQQTTQQGLNTLQQPAGYWSRLLGGNRAAMAQATAAPRAAITDIYSGAQRGLERSNVRGAARDVASAELNREQAGKIAGLTTGIQPAAAGALSDIGTNMAEVGGRTSAIGGSLAGQGANIWGNLLGQGFQNRTYGRWEGEKAGTSIGGFLFDLLSGTLGKGKIPTIRPTTNYGGMSSGPARLPTSIF